MKKTLLRLIPASLSLTYLVASSAAFIGCGAAATDGGGSGGKGNGSGGDNGGTGGGICFTCGSGGGVVIREGCGDGTLAENEACDDGNNDSGDGCFADCSEIEVGFSCPTAGEACTQIAKCGDGITTFPEFCDDGGNAPGDGCSARCTFELGYKCDGSPSVCTTTTCGDKALEGAESCDDGNTSPYDGCAANCQAEPSCGTGACTSDCGDGLVIGEECDDGNSRDGDGCSASCKIEKGYVCEADDTVATSLLVPIVYRDFRAHEDSYKPHPNFHWSGFSYVTPDIVKTTLDADGKPEYSGVGNLKVDSQDNFKSWYRDDPDFNKTIIQELTLTQSGAKYTFSDTEFFPLDVLGWRDPMETNKEPLFAGAGGDHNFHFTSEVRYWVQYDPAKNATLKFLGDDDVWVFLAGKLVVDLGGVHDAVPGEVTLSATTKDVDGNALNLVEGKVYEIAVFQAERNPGGSNYTLELSGFNKAPSICSAVCGDGVLGLGEQCDDGENLGGYGKCAPNCVLTEYCGDGIKQENEYCDDGNRVNNDACNNACRAIITK